MLFEGKYSCLRGRIAAGGEEYFTSQCFMGVTTQGAEFEGSAATGGSSLTEAMRSKKNDMPPKEVCPHTLKERTMESLPCSWLIKPEQLHPGFNKRFRWGDAGPPCSLPEEEEY